MGGSYRKQVFSEFYPLLFFSPLEYPNLLQGWLSVLSFLFTALGLLIVFLTGRAVDPQGCMLRCCSTSPWAVLRAGAQSFPWTALGVVQQALWMRIAQTTAWCLLACGLRQLIFILLWAHGVLSYQTPLQGTGSLRWGYVLGTYVNILCIFMVKWTEACSGGYWWLPINPLQYSEISWMLAYGSPFSSRMPKLHGKY